MPKRKAKKAATGTIDMSEREYRRISVVGKDGKRRHSASNDDAVARALTAFMADGGDIMKVVRDNKLTDKYDGTAANPGMLRMNVGNSLRALVRAGTPVKIGEVTVKTLEQRVADPAAPAVKKKAA